MADGLLPCLLAAGAILRTLNLPREIVLNINDAAYSSQSREST